MRMKPKGLALLTIVIALAVLSLLLPGPARADEQGQRRGSEPITAANEQIKVVANELGQYTIGSVGGDPATFADDDKRLQYGFGDGRFTSFTTVRIVARGETQDQPLLRLATAPRPTQQGGGLTMGWNLDGLAVTQTLTPADNPYTDRADTVRIAISATNTTDAPISAGVRIMLDTMIGNNDRAPFFVPGAGNFDTEREFRGDAMPVYWKAFEAEDYDEASLKGQGILAGDDATPPDRLVFAMWPSIKDSAWDYRVNEGLSVGDSAVAMYWEPEELAPGASVTFVTYYGLAGVGGGNAWIDAPMNITSDAPEFSATLWVTNLSDADFTGGEAVITLPQGLRLAEGETERKPMETVPVNGGAQSVSWRLVGEGDADATYPYSGTVTFQTGSGPLSADASVAYRFVAPAVAPTATPTVPPVVAPVAPAPEQEDRGFPWWLLLLPLLLLPLLLLLLRRQPSRPTTRVAPPRAPRSAPEPDFTERQQEAGASGASVTHGRKKADPRDPRENPLG